MGNYEQLFYKDCKSFDKGSELQIPNSGVLEIFLKAGTENSHNKVYQFWRQYNQPKELITEGFARQKLDYIHNNPVEAGIVEKAEDYLYSSAMDYMTNKKGILEIKNLY